MVTGAGAMFRARLDVAKTPVESFTVTLTVNGPGAVGVPLKAPVVDNAMPEGNPLAENV